MRFVTVSALAVVLAFPAPEAAGEWIQKGMHGGKAREHKAEKKRWRELGAEMKTLSVRDVQWGKELRPRGSRVVTLSRRHATEHPSKLEVEWFFTYTRGWKKGPSQWLEGFLRRWMETLPNGVYLKATAVGSMKGYPNRYDAQHTAHQQLAFASDAIGHGDEVHQAMRARLSNRHGRQKLHRPRDIERFLEGLGVPVERYLEAQRSEEVQARMRAATAKLDAVSDEASSRRREANLPPRDPILLVNGKHLVQGSLAGGIRNTLRVANWLIREELEVK